MTVHRDQLPPCASCGAGLQPQGTRLICGTCGGALVTNAELERMMNEMSPDDERPLERRLLPGTAAARTCPRCSTPMMSHTMYGVSIDRCVGQGVWFDGQELASVLHANGEMYASRQLADRPADGLGGILAQALIGLFRPGLKKRMLERDIKATSPADTSSED